MYTGEGNSEIEFEEVKAGDYLCKLTNIKGIGRTEDDILKAFRWKNGVKSDEQYEVVRFVFKVDGKENAYICKQVAATTSNRGGLYKFIQFLTDDWRKIYFNEKGYAEASDFMQILEALRDEKGMFRVTKSVNQYGALVCSKAYPTDEKPTEEINFPDQEKAPAIESAESAPPIDDEHILDFDEDDIPF